MKPSINDLLAAEPREGSARFSLHVLEPGNPFRHLAESVEQEVFAEFFDISREGVHETYERYASNSWLLLIVDRLKQEKAGAVRIVTWSEAGLPTFDDVASFPEWNRDLKQIWSYHGWTESISKVVDLTTQSIRKPYRKNPLLRAALYHATYWQSLVLGCDRWVSLMDAHAMELFHSIGVEWEPICNLPPVQHVGSEATTPVSVAMTGLPGTVRNKSNEMGDILVYGHGIGDLVALPPLVLAEVENVDNMATLYL